MRYLKLALFPYILVLIGCVSNNAMHAEAAVAQTSSHHQRQIVRTVSLTISVDDIEEKVGILSSMVESYGGYVKSSNRYTEKRANLYIKVPSKSLGSFISETSSLGKVTSTSTSTKDVTEQISDIDARLKNLIALRARYRELLAKANTIEEMLSIEKELSKVQTEIDTIDGRKKLLLDQVTMSSVNVIFKQKTIYGPLGYVSKGFVWIISKLFVIK